MQPIHYTALFTPPLAQTLSLGVSSHPILSTASPGAFHPPRDAEGGIARLEDTHHRLRDGRDGGAIQTSAAAAVAISTAAGTIVVWDCFKLFDLHIGIGGRNGGMGWEGAGSGQVAPLEPRHWQRWQRWNSN